MQLTGFGNHHQSETEKGLLPDNQNAPQHCSKGLYPEQLTGSAFTRARHLNLKSWLYRRYPSVQHHDFNHYSARLQPNILDPLPPNPLRWLPRDEVRDKVDFIDSWTAIAHTRTNSTYLYNCCENMDNRYLNNLDGELLIIPYEGALHIATEFGKLQVQPGEICVIPRGVYFKVLLLNHSAQGYLCENRASPLTLPQLGPIGANGLANPRHFTYPTAEYEAEHREAELINKFQQHLWHSKSNSTPLNVAAWQGNYAPYSYNLALFNTINTVSFDHPDPSIFTVLTSESSEAGVANLDFVIFPARWMVAEHSFRPPYFHRNVMSELMGLIHGHYDAKSEGFNPGGFSIHNCMSAHGPDVSTTDKAKSEDLKPHFFDGGLAFMLESRDIWQVEEQAYNHSSRQKNYSQCWQGFNSAEI